MLAHHGLDEVRDLDPREAGEDRLPECLGHVNIWAEEVLGLHAHGLLGALRLE